MAVKRVLSTEDTNLSSSVIKANQKINYRDVDLSFEIKPSGDVYKKLDADAVKQSVKNLISTNFYEKPFDPFFGANITDLLFELADEFTAIEAEKNIRDAISYYEPRVEIVSISSNINQLQANTLDVSLTFRIINTIQEISIKTTLSRLR